MAWHGITDGKDRVNVEADGSLPVTVQDATTPLVIVPLHQYQGENTLAVDAVIDEYTMTLTDATGFVDGNTVIVSDDAESQIYIGKQVGAPVGNVITLDRPLDYTYTAGFTVTRSLDDMSVNGSVTTQTFGLRQGISSNLDLTVDIVRVITTIYTATTPTLSEFGDITGGLTMGITLRRRDGNRVNIFNVKDNGDLAALAYDLQFLSAIGGGQDGLVSRLTFGGWSKMGAVVRLAPDEDLELIVNDDLSSLQKMIVMAEGSVAIVGD